VVDWVLAAERAYVAAAVGGAVPEDAPAAGSARGYAAAGAVASRYLAVGTPRSFGIVAAEAGGVSVEDMALALDAHRTWFAPRDVRCAAGDAAALAAATGGRVVGVDEALACDIVCIYSHALRIAPSQLRRGTHVNAPADAIFDRELLARAMVTPAAGLPALAAGLVDGRQLDELTIFVTSLGPLAL
jgi:hypothetical protein